MRAATGRSKGLPRSGERELKEVKKKRASVHLVKGRTKRRTDEPKHSHSGQVITSRGVVPVRCERDERSRANLHKPSLCVLSARAANQPHSSRVLEHTLYCIAMPGQTKRLRPLEAVLSSAWHRVEVLPHRALLTEEERDEYEDEDEVRNNVQKQSSVR